MTSHTVLRSRRSRTLSLGLASVLTLGTLGVVAPLAQADDPVAAPTLRWLVSEQFRDHLSTHTFDGGASEDENKVVTFPNGVGSYNPNGAASISYGGSVTAGFVNGGTEYYRVTIAEPRVVIDGDGEGVLSAVVSAWSVAQGQNPEASTDPKRVIVTTFDAGADDWSEGSARRTLTATPDWLGVLPAGSQQAIDLGITATDRPVDGASFAPSFLAQLTPAIRAHFYLTGVQPKKQPATIVAAADPISVTAEPTVTDSGVSVAVNGTGFSGESLAGDNGVYVGIAPSGGLPDVSSQQAMASFAKAEWIPAGSITNGVLSTTVTAPTDKLDPTETYSVYTWQAHRHSTTSQDTETELAFDITPEPSPSTTPTPTPTETTAPAPAYVMTITRLVTDRDTRYGTAAKATATVTTRTGAPVTSGKVELSGHGSTQTANVVNGKVSFTLPKNVAVGTHTLTAVYSGEGLNLISTSTTRLTVSKANVSGKVSVSKKPTSKKTGTATVTITGAAGVTAPSGIAYLKFTKGKSSKTVKVTLSNGTKTVTVPKLKKGTWKVYVKYNGDARYNALGYKKVASTKVTK